MAHDDELTQHDDADPASAALARAIKDVVGKSAKESASAAGSEAVAVMRGVPDLVRRQVDEMLGRHGVRQIPDELKLIADRFDAIAARITTALNEASEADREHLESTLASSISDMKQELSHAVLSLTQTAATSNQRIAALEKSVTERLEILEMRSASVMAIEPRVSSVEQQLALAPAAVRAVENKVEVTSAMVQAIGDKISEGPSAIRALNYRFDTIENAHKTLSRGIAKMLLVFGGALIFVAALLLAILLRGP